MPDEKRFEMQVQLSLLASEIDTRIEPHPFDKSDFESDFLLTDEIKKRGIEINIA